MLRINRQNKTGLTFIETLVAAAVAVLVIVALLQAYVGNIYLAEMAKGNTIATDDLKDMIEKILSVPYNELLIKFPNGTIDGPAGNRYNSTVIGNYSMKSEHIVVTYANLTSDPLEVIVNVTWTDSKNRQHSNFLTTKKTR